MTQIASSERLLVKYPLFKAAIGRLQECFDSFNSTADPICCPIVGESGGGKTTIITHFSSLHPSIDRKTHMEIPVLVVKVPARPTVKSLAETLLYAIGDPLWSKGNTVSKTIRIREIFRHCHVRLLALDDFQHFVDVRRSDIANDVADWLKEQIEVARMPIAVLGLRRCLEVLKQNEQLRRRFGATLNIGAFSWDSQVDRKSYRAFLQVVQEQMPDYVMPSLSDLDMAFRIHYASYGLVGYTMKIIRGAARIASRTSDRAITMDVLSESFKVNVWADHLEHSNPFLDRFDPADAPPITLPSETIAEPVSQKRARAKRLELHT